MAIEDTNILTWNVANWITVVLMAGIGFALLGWAQNVVANRQKTQAS